MFAGVRDSPPYSYLNDNGKWTGIDIELFQEITKETGCQINVSQVTFSDGLMLLDNGKIDIMPQMSIRPERLAKYHFLGPIREEYLVLISTNAVIENISQLKTIGELPYLFGKRKTSYIGDEAIRLMKTDSKFATKFIEINSKLPRIELVNKGRIVGFLIEHLNFVFRRDRNPDYKKMKVHPLLFSIGDVYLGLSKKSVSIEQFVNLQRAVDEIKSSGTYESILARYPSL